MWIKDIVFNFKKLLRKVGGINGFRRIFNEKSNNSNESV